MLQVRKYYLSAYAFFGTVVVDFSFCIQLILSFRWVLWLIPCRVNNVILAYQYFSNLCIFSCCR